MEPTISHPKCQPEFSKKNEEHRMGFVSRLMMLAGPPF